MFLGIIASNSKVGPPIWVPDGIKINVTVCWAILEEQVRPWIDTKYAPGTWVWQQDGASAHTAKVTQKWLVNQGWSVWHKDEWLPSSPHLAPSDYAIWDKIASMACMDTAPDVGTMKEKVNAAWHQLDADFMCRVCHGFRRRLESVLAVKGGWME